MCSPIPHLPLSRHFASSTILCRMLIGNPWDFSIGTQPSGHSLLVLIYTKSTVPGEIKIWLLMPWFIFFF